ncbi:MAG: tripartite tricarboxylate transporter TctB family protein [Hyphomicrobiaceae bacterium]
MSDLPSAGAQPTVRFGREFGAGMLLVLLAAGGLIGSWSLNFGQMSGVGPGLMPQATAALLGLLGIVLLVQALLAGSEPLEAWSLRGMLLVLGAIGVFAATIRPFGLAFAGPVAMIMASLADPSTRPREIIPFAIILPALSIGLFKYALRLPIPLAPPLLGY